ncbi:MAG: ligase-associated DNA damage response endonuclease PdeM [Anaerolineae bacterium]|nr:ligase-associated DNA damage response endonuclease PdeM [Anaerolineae bacterium]
MTDYTLELHSETLILMPERAIYWPRAETMFIADPHVGKAATFRAYAVPLPEGNMQDDLDRLSGALARTGANRLIILGDLLHAAKGRDSAVLDIFTRWRAAHPDLDIHLIIGNHDQRAGELPAEWHIHAVNGPIPGPYFGLNHEPYTPSKGYALCGHLHPAVSLNGAGQQLKLPCFWFGKCCGILPAFASFTGGQAIRPAPGDQIFVVTERQVISYR